MKPSQSLGTLLTAVLCLYAATVLVIGLGSARVLTRHEVLAAQPAREMIAFGHWVIPTFVGIPRLIKPPGMGWLIAISMELFQSHAEWVARLPSALAGIAITLMTAAIAARVLGRAAGFIAGIFLVTSHFVVLQARLAEADMPLAATVCAAMAAYFFASLLPDDRALPRWYGLTFFAATGTSVLLKGLVGPMFVFSAVVVDLAIRRDRRMLRFALNPLGWLLFLAIGLSWPVAAWLKRPDILAVWKHEMFGRFAGEMNSDDATPQPWHFYIYNVPFMLLPWFPLAIVGLSDCIRRRWYRLAPFVTLTAWCIPGIVILSFSAWKHKHYPIPALPPLVIAAAWGMVVLLSHVRKVTRPRISLVTALIVIVAGIVGTAIMLHRAKSPVISGGAWELLALSLGIAATTVALSRGAPRAAFISIAATAWAVIIILYLMIVPRLEDQYRHFADLGVQVSAEAPASEPIYLFGTGESHIAYYLPLRMIRIDPAGDQDLDDASAFMHSLRQTVSKPGIGIAPPDWVERIQKLTPVQIIRSEIPNRAANGVDRGGLVYFRFGKAL